MEELARKLAGKVALVTGAARGLGRAYALRLARLGADVAVNDVNLDAWAEFDEELTAPSVAAECRAFGVRAIEIEADVSKKASAESLVRQTVEQLGSVDILVNNAGGMLRPAEVSQATVTSEEDFRFILDVNLMSTLFCCQAAAPVMKAKGWGRIVNVSSQAALGGGLNLVSYGVAKAAIIRYTRSLAAELGPHGINVNAIAPGLILTSRAAAQFPERKDAGPRIPLRRVGVPEDCAKVIEFFCTDLSDYVTGQVLAVCGGLVLNAI